MKRLLTLITAFTLILTSCEGPQGPPGFDGFDGLDSDEFAALAFEINNVDFSTNNNFEVRQDFQLLSSDVVLVYRQTNPQNPNDLPIWQLLPQTYFIDDAGNDLVYNYDFTEVDMFIFLDSSLELTAVGNEWTDNQNFRVVVLPTVDFSTIDVSNIDNVIQSFNIGSFQTL